MKSLINGAAGFNGFQVAQTVLSRGDEVTGLDNLNAYIRVADHGFTVLQCLWTVGPAEHGLLRLSGNFGLTL
jgi:nucleoside-diphosphate-sugar epimerase